MSKNVVLGFSGGIDSMTAAQLLRGEGYSVSALTLDTVGDEVLVRTAKSRAQELDLPLYVADVKKYII